MVFGGALIATLVILKVEIKSILNRLALIKWGAAELSIPQPPSEFSDEVDAETNIADTDPKEKVGETEDSETQAKAFKQAYVAERKRAHLWEYRFLDRFLVWNTQRILDWLINEPDSPTFTMYDAWWQRIIPSAEERRIIIQVLEDHNLIAMQGELISVTEKGREYAAFRGPLPQATNPDTSIRQR